MSYDDFCRCDSDELDAIFRSFSEHNEKLRQDEWERMRIAATIGIQPHLRRKLSATQLLPLPWDSKKTPVQSSKATELSPEQRKSRFERLAKLS